MIDAATHNPGHRTDEVRVNLADVIWCFHPTGRIAELSLILNDGRPRRSSAEF